MLVKFEKTGYVFKYSVNMTDVNSAMIICSFGNCMSVLLNVETDSQYSYVNHFCGLHVYVVCVFIFDGSIIVCFMTVCFTFILNFF